MAKLGYDLEFAVRETKSNSFIPAGVLPITGTKGNPEPLLLGGVEIDCAAVEITPYPAEEEEEFTNNILFLLEEVKKKYSPLGYEFVAKPSVFFTEQVLMSTPHAMTMGCLPDYNAWTGRRNDNPKPQTELRTFGGHIHIEGGDKNTIKSCDLVLGMWSVLKDADQDRRKLYGKAGAYREKPYGVEYRVLSNFWCENEELIRQTYKYTRLAQRISDPDSEADLHGGPNKIQTIINFGLVDEAKSVLEDMEKKYAA